MRKKEISANKASKVYKIPSSTLYKIARKEGIELAQPFNAVATTWSQVNTAHTITVTPDPDLPCPGRPEHRAGGHQGRHGRAEGRHRVRDPERDAVRPLQEGRDRAQQEHAGAGRAQYRHCHPNWVQYSNNPLRRSRQFSPSPHLQVHWSEDDMTMALDSVRTGNMSINQVTRTRQRVSSVL